MSDDILAEVHASPPRRWMAVAMQMLLGLMLLYIAFVQPPSLGWQAFLVALGLGAIYLGMKTFRASERTLFLSRDRLFDSSGAEIARLENIDRIERGVFALKPSNGFMLIQKSRDGTRHWQPGIWWRLGKRVGVGGVAPGHQTKAMAQIIEALLAERDAG